MARPEEFDDAKRLDALREYFPPMRLGHTKRARATRGANTTHEYNVCAH